MGTHDTRRDRFHAAPMLIVSAISALLSIVPCGASGQAPAFGEASVAIRTPAPRTIAAGDTLIDIAVPPDAKVARLVIFVDGRELCSRERPPWSCRWDAGKDMKERHLRVVATFADGRRNVANRRTQALEVAESVHVAAVQVPALVTGRDGRFARGLHQADFTLLEDDRVQHIDTLIDDSLPLELIVAVDMSGSMEDAMPQVRDAVKRLLARLRPGDTTTLVGFNDTMFVLVESETDPELREAAVEGLLPWGGTALYDATVSAVELVREQRGRRGVIVFSDGDDRHSVVRKEEALARIQEGQVVVYTVGFGRGRSARFRETLTAFAHASGGRAFFPERSNALDAAFDSILDELSHQYVLSYVSDATDARDWRRLEVKARCEGCKVRAREGYRVPDR